MTRHCTATACVIRCSEAYASHQGRATSFLAGAAVAGALYEGRGTYGDVITYAERLFGRIRQAVACQAAPTTLKAAFLDPVEAGSMATEVALELFAKADVDFMTMFTGKCHTAIAQGKGVWVKLSLCFMWGLLTAG
jgi:hypothetical protein